MLRKTSLLSLALPLWLLGGAVVLPSPARSAPTRGAIAAPTLTDRELARLAAPEPGAPAAEYRVRAVTLRLFGTQGTGAGKSATLADTATWATHTYTLGQTVGRSLVLSAVHEDTIELRDSLSGAVSTVRAGADVAVKLVEHAFDFAAVDHGQHQWSVRAAVLGQILGRYGVGATATEVTLNNTRTARLSAVKPGSALARLGFQEGDLLVSVSRGISGQPLAGPLVELPAAMCAALSQPSSQTVLVTLLRGGQRFDLAYAVE
ncbi:MAG: hypothetical protein U1A78_17480 [Polyangia bacterium]